MGSGTSAFSGESWFGGQF